jgi:Ca2+/Na+ antiporter
VVSIARQRSSLAVGNIVGSSISNILGAFSLGLIFHKEESQIVFDGSSKVYTLLLLLLTILIAGLSEFGHHDMWRIVGDIVIGLFVVYVTSIAWFITKRRMTAPELSNSESNSDNESSSDEGEDHTPHHAHSSTEGMVATSAAEIPVPTDTIQRVSAPDAATGNPVEPSSPAVEIDQSDYAAALNLEALRPPFYPASNGNYKHSVIYHIGFLVLGFLAILLSSYVLSHAASNLVDEIGISDVLFGVVILSIATTLPEKFIAVISGYRGHVGILVANTVGSNIFLLSLCMGILWVSTGGSFDHGSVNAPELGVMLGSTLALTFTVWCGARWSRCLGVIMLVAYIAFLVLEFTVIRKVWSD